MVLHVSSTSSILKYHKVSYQHGFITKNYLLSGTFCEGDEIQIEIKERGNSLPPISRFQIIADKSPTFLHNFETNIVEDI